MKDDRLYLHHMLERCHRITRFIGPGRETFMASEELQDAVIRNVEVIGGAAKRVSAEARGRLLSLDASSMTSPRHPTPVHAETGYHSEIQKRVKLNT